jgi:hypothetical protein
VRQKPAEVPAPADRHERERGRVVEGPLKIANPGGVIAPPAAMRRLNRIEDAATGRKPQAMREMRADEAEIRVEVLKAEALYVSGRRFGVGEQVNAAGAGAGDRLPSWLVRAVNKPVASTVRIVHETGRPTQVGRLGSCVFLGPPRPRQPGAGPGVQSKGACGERGEISRRRSG